MSRRSDGKEIGDGQLLELIGDVCGLLDIEELRRGLLTAIERVLPSEYVSLNDVGPDPGTVVTMMRPHGTPELLERFVELAHENPLLRRYLRTLDGQAYRFSDVVSRSELHQLAIYREVYAPLGVEYQLAFNLPAAPDRVLAIALSRRDRDFSDGERDFVNRARPFMIQAYLNATAFEALRPSPASDPAAGLGQALRREGLSAREAEVLALVALGRSNRHIAATLAISHRTVGKHLENGYRKLGVGDRSTAAGRVWGLTSGG